MSDELMEAKYFLAFAHGDDGIIDLLDTWLEDFLFRRNQCPECGDFLPKEYFR